MSRNNSGEEGCGKNSDVATPPPADPPIKRDKTSTKEAGKERKTVKVYVRCWVYFAIYYVNATTDSSRSFERAAQTWVRELKQRITIRSKDRLILKAVTTESDFRTAWDSIWSEAISVRGLVREGIFFGHATRSMGIGLVTFHGDDGTSDGLEFAADNSKRSSGNASPNTMTQVEIEALPRLPWGKTLGKFTIAACNSGVIETAPFKSRGWAPAASFASSQKVKTIGAPGFCYFSSAPDRYVPIDPMVYDEYYLSDAPIPGKPTCSLQVYLWAYRHGKNILTGKGWGVRSVRMEDVIFDAP